MQERFLMEQNTLLEKVKIFLYYSYGTISASLLPWYIAAHNFQYSLWNCLWRSILHTHTCTQRERERDDSSVITSQGMLMEFELCGTRSEFWPGVLLCSYEKEKAALDPSLHAKNSAASSTSAQGAVPNLNIWWACTSFTSFIWKKGVKKRKSENWPGKPQCRRRLRRRAGTAGGAIWSRGRFAVVDARGLGARTDELHAGAHQMMRCSSLSLSWFVMSLLPCFRTSICILLSSLL